MITRLLRPVLAWSLVLVVSSPGWASREKDATQYGMGVIVNLPFPESDVVQVVQEIVQNGIIRGTKEYNKDEYVAGATAVSTSRAFPEWTEGGKVFYKVRLKALDPRNFKNASDVGTLAVRYVIQAQDSGHTVLHIDAIFVEDFRHTVHLSNGSVEGAEYKDIHDHLDAMAEVKAQTVTANQEKQQQLSRSSSATLKDESNSSATAENITQPTPAADNPPPETKAPELSPKTPEQQLHDLRQQVQRIVKQPGAPLKSAPFHTASTLQLVPAGSEVLIVISTPYWVGIETHEGQHGWMLRDELELLP